MPSEIHWFVQVVYSDAFDRPVDPIDPDPRTPRPRFFLLRGHSWKDAYDMIRKDRFSNHTWGLYPLERDGTFFAGDGFRAVDPGVLKQAGFRPEYPPPDHPGPPPPVNR